MALLLPALNKGSKSVPGINLLNPSLIASSVKDEIQSLFIGALHSACSRTHLCISSPSWPASPQFITSVAF